MNKVLYGWAFVSNDGLVRDFIPKSCMLLGVVPVELNEPSNDDVEKYNKDWPGLAPYKIVPLYGEK